MLDNYYSWLKMRIKIKRMKSKFVCYPLQQWGMAIRGEKPFTKTNRKWIYRVETCSQKRYRQFTHKRRVINDRLDKELRRGAFIR